MDDKQFKDGFAEAVNESLSRDYIGIFKELGCTQEEMAVLSNMDKKTLAKLLFGEGTKRIDLHAEYLFRFYKLKLQSLKMPEIEQPKLDENAKALAANSLSKAFRKAECFFYGGPKK